MIAVVAILRTSENNTELLRASVLAREAVAILKVRDAGSKKICLGTVVA